MQQTQAPHEPARQTNRKRAQQRPDPFIFPAWRRAGVLIGAPNSARAACWPRPLTRRSRWPTTHSQRLCAARMWEQDDIQLELVDTPPIIGRACATGLMGTIHNADIVCIVVEAGETALDQPKCAGVLSRAGVDTASRRAAIFWPRTRASGRG